MDLRRWRHCSSSRAPSGGRLCLRPAPGQELHPEPGTARDGASLGFLGNAAWVRASVVRCAVRVSALFFLRYMAAGLFGASCGPLKVQDFAT